MATPSSHPTASTLNLNTVRHFNTMPVTSLKNTESSLLNLPPEIREAIWRLVLGVEGETIHLYRHEYTEDNDNNHQSSPPPLQLDSSTGKRYVLKPSCCRASREWDQAYQLSQTSEEFSSDARDRRGRLRQDATGVLSSYNVRHRHCRGQDVHCQHGKHTMQCRASQAGLNVDCVGSREKHLHLNVLRVCRSIYFEAAHLPYKLNTFSFPNETNLAFFTKHVLRPWQRASIQSITVASEPPVARATSSLPCHEARSASPVPSATAFDASEEEIDIEDLTFEDKNGLESSLVLFPNLQHLKLSISFVKDPYLAKLRIPEVGQGDRFTVPVIPNVQVVVGADTDTYWEYESGTREERRELALAVEMFLQGRCCELYERSMAWWRFLLCNGRAVPCKNYEQPWLLKAV